MIESIEALVGSPPEREGVVVQLFAKDGGQWAEIYRAEGFLEIEIYPRPEGETLRFGLDDLQRVIELARGRL